MRSLVIVLSVAAIAAPAALAKGRLSVGLGDSTPRVGQPFTVYVRTGWVVPGNDWLRLIAVAPKQDWYDVVGTVTGDSSLSHANIPHDGFEIKLRRVGPLNWRAVVRLPPAGTVATGRPEWNAPRLHGSAACGVDALGARSPLEASER